MTAVQQQHREFVDRLALVDETRCQVSPRLATQYNFTFRLLAFGFLIEHFADRGLRLVVDSEECPPGVFTDNSETKHLDAAQHQERNHKRSPAGGILRERMRKQKPV